MIHESITKAVQSVSFHVPKDDEHYSQILRKQKRRLVRWYVDSFELYPTFVPCWVFKSLLASLCLLPRNDSATFPPRSCESASQWK
ncbi:hypothetical protein TNCV_1244981 [Trichonephila clavipes]|nr:hypothetical protein TNCV_1244981 [Trichonephila clavipes]